MISLTPWLGVTIFGFVYVTAGVFLFLSYAGEYRLGFLKHAQPYAPYLAVLVLFLSYLVGLVAHLLSQQVWVAFFHSADAYNARRLIALQADTPRDLLTSLGNSVRYHGHIPTPLACLCIPWDFTVCLARRLCVPKASMVIANWVSVARSLFLLRLACSARAIS